MMHQPPRLIGAARVLGYVSLPAPVPTGSAAGSQTIAGLALCQYEDAPGFYLFGCDDSWQSVTDTWHESLTDARDQAEADFGITADAWAAHEAIWVFGATYE